MSKKNKKTVDEIQFDNEFLKLKMQAETGAQIKTFGDKLPPEIENIFLKNIMNFEQQFRCAKRITIRELFGSETFISYRKITKENFANEIKNVLTVYNKYNINVDCCAEVDNKVFYRFLTEELLENETYEKQTKGWTTNFIYEEFHPNDKLDISDLLRHFVYDLFDKNTENMDFKMHVHTNFTRNNGVILGKPIATDKIYNFRNAFDKIVDAKADIISIENTKLKGTINANIYYKAYVNKKPLIMEGNATFKVRKDKNGYWNISGINMPGLVI